MATLRTLRQNPRTEIKEPVIARSRRRRSNLARIENLKQRLLRSPRNDTLTVCQTGGVLSRSPKRLNLPTYPHQKHEGNEENVIASQAPDFIAVLREVESLVQLSLETSLSLHLAAEPSRSLRNFSTFCLIPPNLPPLYLRRSGDQR